MNLNNDTVFVGGRVQATSGNDEWLVQARDAATGGLLRQDQLSTPGGSAVPTDIAVQSGSIVVSGVVADVSGNDNLLVRAYES